MLICSFLAHSSLLGVFTRAPQELPSIGIPAISVEIVLGDDAPAGVAATPGQEDATQAKQEVTVREPVTTTPQEPASVTRSLDPPQIVEEARRPDETRSATEVVVASEPKQLAPTAPEPLSAEPEPVSPEARPKVHEVEPTPPAPRTAEQANLEPAKPVHSDEPPELKAKQQTPASAPPPPSASGISRGRSTADANYSARVAAHLARHKQFPADARSRRQQGSASVSFSIDGGGRVTQIRLIRSAGSVILDREAQSMVRRASPFPPPPSGLPQSFSVPVSFSMR